MKKLMQKIESWILTKLFTRWVNGEYDLETLEVTKSMIENREYELKWAIDKLNHKQIIGFQSNFKKDEE